MKRRLHNVWFSQTIISRSWKRIRKKTITSLPATNKMWFSFPFWLRCLSRRWPTFCPKISLQQILCFSHEKYFFFAKKLPISGGKQMLKKKYIFARVVQQIWLIQLFWKKRIFIHREHPLFPGKATFVPIWEMFSFQTRSAKKWSKFGEFKHWRLKNAELKPEVEHFQMANLRKKCSLWADGYPLIF